MDVYRLCIGLYGPWWPRRSIKFARSFLWGQVVWCIWSVSSFLLRSTCGAKVCLCSSFSWHQGACSCLPVSICVIINRSQSNSSSSAQIASSVGPTLARQCLLSDGLPADCVGSLQTKKKSMGLGRKGRNSFNKNYDSFCMNTLVIISVWCAARLPWRRVGGWLPWRRVGGWILKVWLEGPYLQHINEKQNLL